MKVRILNYGGIIQSILVPDSFGNFSDVVLGFDHPSDYLRSHPYFGALIGRFGNRIAQGRFILRDNTYHLPVNHGAHTLHGGLIGFDKVFWSVENHNLKSLTLTYDSPDGDQGFPGNLKTEVTYELGDDQSLTITYKATTTKETPINLTNHSYFNLSNHPQDRILDHKLMINAVQFVAVDQDLIPTGELLSVRGPMDFRDSHSIRDHIDEVGGYDHSYVLNKNSNELSLAATLCDPQSGRRLEVYTTEPGLQFYSGNFLDGTIKGKRGIVYRKHQGLCLETQHFPDSPNHPNFPSTILRPGETYHHKTIYLFSTV